MSEQPHPKIGEWDNLHSFIGMRGYGKSTDMVRKAVELSDEANGAYVVGHSLGARLPTKLPDGTLVPIKYHRKPDELPAAMNREPDKWHVATSGSADDVIRYARALSLKLREKAYGFGFDMRKDMTGRPCPPVIVLIDEGVALQAADKGASREEKQEFLETLFSLRHEHIALLYAIQNANARSYIMMEQSTSITTFRVRHRWALDALRAAGMSEEDIKRVPNLKKYEKITFT